MAVLKIHVAGEIFGNKQTCRHCGEVLYDYTNTTAIGKSTFTFFRPGTIVTMTSAGPIEKAVLGVAACTK